MTPRPAAGTDTPVVPESGAPAHLFAPVRVGGLMLPNRMVMAPMTRCRAGDEHVPGALSAEYYAQRATAGLIVTEASQVSPQGVGYPGTPGIHSTAQVAGWRAVTDAVHAAGGRVFLQLWHVGRISHPLLQPDRALPVAPSAIRPAGAARTARGPKPFATPRALETRELPGIVAQYRRGAENARDAGFDGVEIHAANGYLLDQFLRTGANHRTDAYGGPVQNRARLLAEVAETVAGVWGPDRVGVRISPVSPANDMADADPAATFLHVARVLSALGLAYLHVVELGGAGGVAREAFDWAALKDAFDGPYIAAAGYTRETAEAALAAGRADLVAFGVPFLANPDLPARFRADAPLNAPDPATFYGGDARGYTDYPALTAAV